MFLQNQPGFNLNKWDRSGILVESSGHNQYRIKVDGSGCLTLQNCCFLCAYTLAIPSIELLPDTTLTTLHCPHSCAAAITAPPLWNQAHPSTPQSPCQEKLSPPPQAPAPGDVSLNAPTAPTSGTTLALEPPVTQAVVPEPLSPLPASPHPCCESQPPKCFEPETGLWVPIESVNLC